MKKARVSLMVWRLWDRRAVPGGCSRPGCTVHHSTLTGLPVNLNGQSEREAWADLLAEYTWDWFPTLTFNLPQRDPQRARSMFTAWLRRSLLQEGERRGLVATEHRRRFDAYGRELGVRVKQSGPLVRAWKKGRQRPVWVLGIEQHKSGANHLHALIRLPEWLADARRDEAWRVWYDKPPHGFNLGIAKVVPPASQGDVRGYVSKYVTKGGELVLSDSFSRATLPRMLSDRAVRAATEAVSVAQ